jgi:hypothetical protein
MCCAGPCARDEAYGHFGLEFDRIVEMEPNNDLGGYRFDDRRRKWPITGGAHLVSPTLCGALETMKFYILPAGHLAAWQLS